ncbi:MAG: hypothetical protein L3J21_02185 [Devosiaceae bacterium]|nr:hypothetical protein [Devosiaceae bacterium]
MTQNHQSLDPSTAGERIENQRSMDAQTLCRTTNSALQSLANIMNQETTLLRNGHYEEASKLSEQKSLIAQEYVGLARVVQHQATRLNEQAPTDLQLLQGEHEKLATQMAENLRVLATAKTVTQNLLHDVAISVGQNEAPKTYGASGQMHSNDRNQAYGISVNRSL